MKILLKVIIPVFVLTCGLCGCNEDQDAISISDDKEDVKETTVDTITLEIPDWTASTHSKDVAPDYAIVFPQNEVLRVDISISESDWSDMQSDLDNNLNTRGPANVDFTPVWVPCSFTFNGKEWYKVGIRYKGNSSLTNAHRSNTDKYPFKLDFDEFEDTYPAIKNQRFYGFKQLNLGSNFDDNSFMRERVASDMFRNFGVPAARTAFCEVYLNRGNGANFVGIYTLTEEVDNTLAQSQFADENGNLYKPDGDAASFKLGSYNEEELDKKSNEDEHDFSDVKSLYDVINSDLRSTDVTTWQSNLESVLDVDQYLKWLAANTVMQNWDTYGLMTHNYFLYNDGGKLVWIPSDNNESLNSNGKMGGPLSLSLSEVGDSWPLINYILKIESYKLKYNGYLNGFVTNVFETSAMTKVYNDYRSLLKTYAEKETNAFDSNVDGLIEHVEERNLAVEAYLK